MTPGRTEGDLLEALQDRIGHRFARRELLVTALVHRSFVHEYGTGELASNQKLEFLGDAVLDMVSAELLMERLPQADEGTLSRLRARLVNARFLAGRAASLGLPPLIRLGKGELATGGRGKVSVLADALEAVVGALYLDGGLSQVRQLVARWIDQEQALGPEAATLNEAKGWLQEATQARGLGSPRYHVVAQTGPDHERQFVVAVSVAGRELARGEGRTKKEAAAWAALAAWRELSAGGAAEEGPAPAPAD